MEANNLYQFSGDFGVAQRTFRAYIRIGEANLNNRFNKETITLFNEGKLTQTQLLDNLRKHENKKIIQSKLWVNRKEDIKNVIKLKKKKKKK
ncbi:hypothetical protein LCGC14_1625030 [marine sediment metagenome]|uniref:Uncharacterized protein n=1 Tax=marine sediment metagenome TaxID=412755 RepID=A0A0F9KJV7_9ZZZZ